VLQIPNVVRSYILAASTAIFVAHRSSRFAILRELPEGEVFMQQPTGIQPKLGVIDAVIEVSRWQAKTLDEMRVALERGDQEEALQKARAICGLDEDK
jgi:hypothetical protein